MMTEQKYWCLGGEYHLQQHQFVDEGGEAAKWLATNGHTWLLKTVPGFKEQVGVIFNTPDKIMVKWVQELLTYIAGRGHTRIVVTISPRNAIRIEELFAEMTAKILFLRAAENRADALDYAYTLAEILACGIVVQEEQ